MKSTLQAAFAFLVVLSAASLNAQQVTIPPGTGASHVTNTGLDLDTNWSIIYSTINEELHGDPLEEAARFIPLTLRGSGWYVTTIGGWIGPDSDQSNAKRGPGCCGGVVTYQLTFNVTSLSQAFDIFFCADDYTDVRLNDNVIYDKTESIFANCKTLPVTAGFLVGQLNYLHFNVTNVNGPTGLYVRFSAHASDTAPKFGPSTAPGQRTILAYEPIDTASGQYFENHTDLDLGGPMNFGFQRYYSSQLSNGKIATSLGTNWMSNFDAFASVLTSSAQVLLPRGLIVSFNKSGNAWQLAAPKATPYQFIQNGTNFQLLDPIRNWVYTFNATGQLTSIADRNGNTITVTQGASGPTQIADGLGRTLTLTYTGTNLTKVTDQAGRSVSYAYTSGLLTSVTDYFAQTTKFNYATVGSATALMTSKQLPLGNSPFTNTYDSQARVLTQKIVAADGTPYTSTLAYDGTGGTTLTDGTGKVSKIVSNSAGNASSSTDANGNSFSRSYDASDRITSVTDKAGNKTAATYDPVSGWIASYTDALGNVTTFTYTAQSSGGFTYYDMTNIKFADGTTDSVTYDAHGNVLSETAANGGVTKYTYDANGRLLTLTDAKNQTSTFTWNSDTTMATLTDALGNKTTFTYDNTKRMTSAADALGNKTSYVLDKSNAGPMTAIVGPVIGSSSSIYDDQNRQLQDVVNSAGGKFHYDYTVTGQLAQVSDSLNHVTKYTYDGDDRISTVTNSAGEKVTYAYDAGGRVTSVSDTNGPRITYTYTTNDLVASATDGAGRKTTYGYDANGSLTSVTTPSGGVYKSTLDKVGLLTSTTNPLGEVTTFSLDAAGAVKSVTAPGGITTSVTRDANEAITSMTSANGNVWNAVLDADGRATKITDPLGQAMSFAYTGDQLTTATLPLGTLTMTYDAASRVTKQTFSDGVTVSNTYDSNGNLTGTANVTITRDQMGRPTNINGIAMTLDGEDRPTTLTYASGKSLTYAYDASGLLSSITDWVGGKTTFAYDGAGKLTSVTYPNGVTTTNTFDADGNVVKIAAGSLASISLTRDAGGKITAADRNLPIAPALTAGSQQYSFDAAGQLKSATYDAMGRVTSQNGRTYTWNLASQLTGFKDGTNTASFTYDGFGEMVSSTATGATQNFVFNYWTDLPALSIVKQGSGDLRYYVYTPDGLLLYSIEANNNARHFYHFDEMGNTAFLTDDKGAVSDSYAITPYGEIAAHTGTMENPFVWQGEFGVMQVGTNLYYVRDRFYDATTARFISRDPELTFDPAASEPYSYAGGNPMLYIDPFGSGFLSWLGDVGKKIGGAVVGAATTVANKAKEIGTGIVKGTQQIVDNVKKAIAPKPPAPVRPVTPAPPAKQPVQTPVQKPAPNPLPTLKASPPVPAPPSGSTGAPCTGIPAPAAALALSPWGLDPLGHVTYNNQTVYANEKGQIVSHDGGSVVSNDGGTILINNVLFVNNHGTLISQDGSNVVSNDGGTFRVANLTIRVPSIVSRDGAGIISKDGAGIIGEHGSGVIGEHSSGFHK